MRIQIISENRLDMLEPEIERRNVAGALIFRNINSENTELLLIKRAKDDHWPNHWEIPRGKVEDEEQIKKGLLREVKEETGLDVNILNYFNKFNYVMKDGNIVKKISTQYNFVCTPKDENQEVKLSFEHQDFRWVSNSAEAELYLYNEIKQTVMMALHKYCEFNINSAYDYDDSMNDINESIFLGKNYVSVH